MSVDSQQHGEPCHQPAQPMTPQSSLGTTANDLNERPLTHAERLNLLLAIVQRFGEKRPNGLLLLLGLTTTATLAGCSAGIAKTPGAGVAIEPPSTSVPPPMIMKGGGEYCMAGDDGCEMRAGDVLLSNESYWMLRDHLDAWGTYPALCGGALADNNDSWQAIVQSLAEVEAARRVEERVRTSKWTAKDYLWFMVGVVGGAVTGFTVGAIVVATQ